MRISDWSSDVCSSDLLERRDVDHELRGDVGGLGGDEQGGEHLVDDAVLTGDQLGLALDDDGHLDVDGLVEVDADEVDVQDVAAHLVALHVLDERGGAAAVDLEVDHGVQAMVGSSEENTSELQSL